MVDDHPATVGVISDALQGAGFLVQSAPAGPEAVLQVQAERPDLVILDLAMPGPDGLDVLFWLRKTEERLPVIVLTARDDEGDREQALFRGADLYLTKPCAMAALVAAVGHLLGGP